MNNKLENGTREPIPPSTSRRRNFLVAAATLSVGQVLSDPARAGLQATASQSVELIRPKVLRPGDTIGLIAPGTAVTDPEQIDRVARTLQHFGLKMKLAGNVGKRPANLEQSIHERLSDFHQVFGDPEVRGVFCIRGGYGCPDLLDRIDYELVRRNPKVFVGYSDVTSLHLAIHKYAHMLTFHGPIVLAKFTPYTEASFRRALFDTVPLGKLTNPPESRPFRPAHPLRTLRPGKATAPIIGGNLTMVCALLGTPYEPDTHGKIFFIEEIDEQPYRIGRMLTQLRLAGKFDSVAGIVFGECANCGPADYKPSFVSPYSLGEELDRAFGGLRVPVLAGLAIGHTDDQLTLPLGATATLDTDEGCLEILDAALSA